MPTDRQSRSALHAPALPLLARLRRDASGNTLAIVAAAMAPLLAIIGSGIDLGRGYMSETRLQQACDSGVLAARKNLGSTVAPAGTPPAGVVAAGNRFFNLNFKNGSYGTEDRSFTMTLAADLTVNGVATVEVPTTVMNLFGFNKVDVSVECSAKLNFTNTDVMMVIDTTGSMNQTNPGDSVSENHRAQVGCEQFPCWSGSRQGPGRPLPLRLRSLFGQRQRRRPAAGQLGGEQLDLSVGRGSPRRSVWTALPPTTTTCRRRRVAIRRQAPSRPMPRPFTRPTESTAAYYTCDGSEPADTISDVCTKVGGETTVPYVGPPAGDQVTQRYQRVLNGTSYWTDLNGATCDVRSEAYSNYTYEYDHITIPYTFTTPHYRYAPITRSVANWRSELNGCMEERATYEINDYDNVDLTRALDLDLDKVPTNDNERWRPMYPDIIRERSLDWDGDGSFTVPEVITTDQYFFRPSNSPSMVACPAPARKLAEMDSTQLTTFLSSITPGGYTYHDIGMIWGGRLISKTGLFAAENADISGRPTSRHLIFLTDGQTNTYDVAYGPYGVEGARPAPVGARFAADTGRDGGKALRRRLRGSEEAQRHRLGDRLRHIGIPDDEGLRRHQPLVQGG